jgi:hypothetical protein
MKWLFRDSDGNFHQIVTDKTIERGAEYVKAICWIKSYPKDRIRSLFPPFHRWYKNNIDLGKFCPICFSLPDKMKIAVLKEKTKCLTK